MADVHQGFCVKSVKEKIPETYIPILENFDFSAALESVYPLLELIFNFLNYEDLKTCCQVKRTWQDAAEKILNKRVQPSWFTCYKTTSKPKWNIFKYSRNLNYNNVGMAIILYDFRRIKLNKFICVHSNTWNLSRKSVPEYLEEEVIPKKVDYCVISCPKVVSLLDIKDVDYIAHASTIDGLLIPKIPNVRTAMFYCNTLKEDNIQKTIDLYIRNNEEVKCLLIFATCDLKKSLYHLLTYLIPENNANSVAVGGGIIGGTKTFQQLNSTKRVYSSNDTFCIVFLQERYNNAEFNAYSYVIYGDDLSREEVEIELLKFRTNISLRTNSVAIRVSCSAKIGAEEELILFNKIFPSIPLLGLNADGEIGWNCFSNLVDLDYGEAKPKKVKHKYPEIQHQWSSVFIIITWGPL